LKRQRQGQRVLEYLRVAAGIWFLDQSVGCVVYVGWEKDILPKKPSGSAIIVAENFEYRANIEYGFGWKSKRMKFVSVRYEFFVH
jgi:hypothetical protein